MGARQLGRTPPPATPLVPSLASSHIRHVHLTYPHPYGVLAIFDRQCPVCLDHPCDHNSPTFLNCNEGCLGFSFRGLKLLSTGLRTSPGKLR